MKERAKLFQNRPNPFSGNTEINYFLPIDTRKAQLYIYDLKGVQVFSIAIKEFGSNSITIEGKTLYPGIFIYSLIADEVEVDSKRMIIFK